MSQTSKSKSCTKCNLEFSTKYKFCTKCGQELKSLNICQNCDFQLKEKSKFCPNCGEPITNENVNYDEQSNSTSEVTSRKVKGFLIGVGIFLVIVFFVVLISNQGSGSNYPACAQIPRGFYLSDLKSFVQTGGWDWGRPDGKVGYCVLPNSNEVFYSEIGSVE